MLVDCCFFSAFLCSPGSFRFIIIWAPPDVLGVQIAAMDGVSLIYTTLNVPLPVTKIYQGQATGGTAGAHGLLFSAANHTYAVTVPYKYGSVYIMANSTTNATVTFDIAYPNPPYQVWHEYVPYPLQRWDLVVGWNALHMNSTLDG
jgi:hypothetical protein